MKTFADRDPEELKEISRKGGISSGESRRKRAALRDELSAILSSGDTQKRLCTALIEKAMTGDGYCFRTIRDTLGEDPGMKLGLFNAQEDLEELRRSCREEIKELYALSVSTGRYKEIVDLLLPKLEDRMSLLEEEVQP